MTQFTNCELYPLSVLWRPGVGLWESACSLMRRYTSGSCRLKLSFIQIVLFSSKINCVWVLGGKKKKKNCQRINLYIFLATKYVVICNSNPRKPIHIKWLTNLSKVLFYYINPNLISWHSPLHSLHMTVYVRKIYHNFSTGCSPCQECSLLRSSKAAFLILQVSV